MSSESSRTGPKDAHAHESVVADFAASVDPHMPLLIRLAARLAPTAADDVIQEALVRAWRYRDRFDPERGTLLNWLLAIVANEARRSKPRGPILPLRIALRAEPLSADDRIDLDAAVQRLSPRQRLAIDCYYYVGLTTSQAAVVMGCSEGTVKSTLADARARLRAMLGEGR